MKTLNRLLALGFLIGLISCTNKKKEEETKVAIEEIEAIESELDQISEEVTTKVKELEDSLEDLDNI